MKKFAFIICLFFVVLLSATGGFSQAVVEEGKDADVKENPDKKEQPQTKPAKSYDLTPKFTKDMKWKETIYLVMSQSSENSAMTMSFNLTSDVKVTKMTNNKASEIKYIDLKGTAINEMSYDGEIREDTDELEKITQKFGLNNDYQLTTDEKLNRKIREFMIFYPDGNILGFVPPKKAVKVGDTWKSETLVPLNTKLIEAAEGSEMIISDLESKFKLKKVEALKKIEVAYIGWTGKGGLAPEDESDEKLSIVWDRTIKFDLTNQRIISTSGSFEGTMNNEKGTFNIQLSRNLEYDKSTAKKEVPKIQPKDDDEE